MHYWRFYSGQRKNGKDQCPYRRCLVGDVFDVCKKYYTQKTTFDTFCAFDFWEHLHPKKLHDYIDSIVALAENDTLFFFNIPAFGEDRVFGEIFPLELEGNREKFEQRLPFAYLNAESIVPPIPANGHLIWSHTEWWQKQFEDHGLVRSEELERNLHHYFDEHLFYARKSFYVFYRNSQKARHRVKRLLKMAYYIKNGNYWLINRNLSSVSKKKGLL